MIDTRTVGKTIATLRQTRGLSQQGLATLCSVTHQAVSKWENGIALPDMQTMLFLSKLFDMSIEDILSGNLPETQVTPVPLNPEVIADAAPPEEVIADPAPAAQAPSEEISAHETAEAEIAAQEAVSETAWDAKAAEVEARKAAWDAKAAEVETQEDPWDAKAAEVEAQEDPWNAKATEADAREAAESESDLDLDWNDLASMLPFASQNLLDELAMQKLQEPSCEKPNMDFIYHALPFLSHSTNEALLHRAIDAMDADMLTHVAPFVSQEFLAELIRKDERLQNPKLLGHIMPFLPRDIVDDMLRKSMGKMGATNTSGKNKRMHINFNWNGKKVNKDIDLSGLENLGSQISDMVTDSLSGLGESLSGIFGRKEFAAPEVHVPPLPPVPPAPPTPPVPSTPPSPSAQDKPERTLMRIARKAVEANNIDWLEEHLDDLNSEEMETLCHVIAGEGAWDLLDALDLDSNPRAARILLDAAAGDSNWEIFTYILELCDFDDDTMEEICRIAADSKNWELMRSLFENANDNCLRILLDAAMQEGNWEIINEISEYL